MAGVSVTHTHITRIENGMAEQNEDLLAVEEPLEIRIGHGPQHKREEFPLAVTMRTPGHDEELVQGFLISEGIIENAGEVISVRPCHSGDHPGNIMKVELSYDKSIDTSALTRNFYASSSCGVCGKATIEAIYSKIKARSTPPQLSKSVIRQLTQRLTEGQSVFRHTGGLHAAAIFTIEGELLLVKEDIGRHNAVDKTIGAAHMKSINLHDKILMLSGRIGFELTQKALMAGCNSIVAIGAPSSLAVEVANSFGMTLIGFLRQKKFNIYSGASNIID